MQKLYAQYLKIAELLVQDYLTLLNQYREQNKPSKYTALRIYAWNKKIEKVKKKIKVLNQ